MKRTPRDLARLLSSFGTHLKVSDWGALREAAAYINQHEDLLEESERVPEIPQPGVGLPWCKCGPLDLYEPGTSPVVEVEPTTEGA